VDEQPGSGTIQCYGSGSGIRCLFDPWIRDPGRVKNQVPDSGGTTRIMFHIWVKILKFFDADPGWKKFGSRINPGSAPLVQFFNLKLIRQYFTNFFHKYIVTFLK
jgi:hypothetical protein